jgi:hypothetical protein
MLWFGLIESPIMPKPAGVDMSVFADLVLNRRWVFFVAGGYGWGE